jgi:Ankyrin repeat
MRAGSSSYSLYSCQLVTDMRPQILVAAGAERDRPNNDGCTPLASAIMGNHPNVAQFLLHSGAKMKNVPPHIKIRAWMHQLVTERRNVMNSTLALKGLLKRRCGLSKDVTHLIAIYFWSMRLK